MILLTADYRKLLSFSFVILLILVINSGVYSKTRKNSFGRKAKSENSKSERVKSDVSRIKRLADDPIEWDGRFVGKNPDGSDVPWAYPNNTPISQIKPVTFPPNKIGSGEVIWYVNGILNNIDDQYVTMKAIARKTGNPVIGIRNSSYGFLGYRDGVQTILDLYGVSNNLATNTLADLIYDELKKENSKGIHLFGHSQGTVIINNAIEKVKKRYENEGELSFCEILQKLGLIKAEIYGSPNYSFVNGPAYVHSCNYLDPVCNTAQARIIIDALIEKDLLFTGISKKSTNVYGAKAYRNSFAKLLGGWNPHSVLKYIDFFRPQTVVFPPPPSCDAAYLYLMDTSGSMGQFGKLQSAQQSALDSLEKLKERSEDKSRFAPTSVFSFAGGCSESSAQQLIEFNVEIEQISKDLPRSLPSANGETPLPQAINVASKTMKDYMTKYDFIKEGYIVVLSDGESTCGAVRPSGTWAMGQGRNVNLGYSFPENTKFLTVGFALAPGSVGERDLQYLAFASGGKYYSAADPRQLKRAFQKVTQSYFPRNITLTETQLPKFKDTLNKAGIALQAKKAVEALKLYLQLEADFKRDGISSPELYFNLAQSLEANDRYKGAVDYYQRYLQSNPQAADKALIEQKIATLKQDYKDQFEYYLKIVESDLTYLKKYYDDLFKKQNNVLAAEFAGFVTEKGEFYTNLQDVLEIQDKNIKDHSKDLSDGLYDLSDKVDSKVFDRDAVSLLTIPISELEEILELLKKDKAKFMNI
jgi:Mg-chelatase subunit ChlD